MTLEHMEWLKKLALCLSVQPLDFVNGVSVIVERELQYRRSQQETAGLPLESDAKFLRDCGIKHET